MEEKYPKHNQGYGQAAPPSLDSVESIAGIGTFILGPDGRQYWSPTALTILGVSSSEVGALEDAAASGAVVPPGPSVADSSAPHWLFEQVLDADRALVDDLLSARLHTEDGRARTTFRIRDSRGRVSHIRATIRVEPEGESRRVTGVLENVTDATLNRKELLETMTMFTEAERVGRMGSFISAPIGDTRWSAGLYRLMHRDPSEGIPADQGLANVHPDDLPGQMAWIEKLRATGNPGPLRVRVRAPDGSYAFLETRAAVSQSDVDGTIRVAGTTVDVSEQVRLEERLHHAAKMTALGTLAAGVVHDYNNYLHIIACTLDLLRPHTLPDGRILLGEMSLAVERSSEITHELLALARKQHRAPRPVAVATMLESTAELLRRTLPSRVKVSVERRSNDVYVNVDRAHLEHALMNLAINARDAMPEGGALSFVVERCFVVESGFVSERDHVPAGTDVLAGHPRTSGEVNVEQRRMETQAFGEEWARIEVRDEGHGIPVEHLSKIFEPYFTSKPLGEGTGLGLASVYGSVHQNGGQITVDSAVGLGTSFSLYLPACEPPTEVPGPVLDSPRSSGFGSDRVVLVVDDLDPVRLVTAQLLRRDGYEVLEVQSPKKVLSMLAEGLSVDMVLSDISMPEMSGVTLFREIRKIRPELELALMTGHASDEELEDARSMVGIPLLQKPFTPDDLLAVIRDRLE